VQLLGRPLLLAGLPGLLPQHLRQLVGVRVQLARAVRVRDVAELATDDIPGSVDLCWASPPCQDVSLAGDRAGLAGVRSGAFWPFMKLMQELRVEGRAPRLIVIENVAGSLTSRGGRDFEAILGALVSTGYRFGAVVIDASLFVPQSRERVFIIAADADVSVPASLLADKPTLPFHPYPLVAVCDPLSDPRFDSCCRYPCVLPCGGDCGRRRCATRSSPTLRRTSRQACAGIRKPRPSDSWR
jgi:site-specific DNA-cytosine methylase